MQKHLYRFLIVLMLLPFMLQAQVLTFTPEQMRSDLAYLNKYLRKWHPSYYACTPRPAMDAFYQALSDSCHSPATMNQFRTRLRQAVNKVGCGHMGVSAPADYNPAVLPELIPLDVWICDNRLYVRNYRGADSLLEPGDEVLSINGIPASEILLRTAELAFSDGTNLTHKTASVQQSFPVFYYFAFGPLHRFRVEFKTLTGQTGTAEFVSVPQSNAPQPFMGFVHDSTNLLLKGDGLALYRLDAGLNAALIDIDRFKGKKHRQTYRQMFRTLRLHDTRQLVVDLRNNGGGGVFKGNSFLSYLLNPAVRGFNFSRRPNLLALNPKFRTGFWPRVTPVLFILNPLQYPGKGGWHHVFPFFRKGRSHFDGQVFVLANGGSFSMAAYSTTYLKYKRGAVVVGEETGGGVEGSRGMNYGEIVLPNTGMRVGLNIYRVRHNVKNTGPGGGVLPDFPVSYSIQDRLQQCDLEMEVVRRLMEDGGQKPEVSNER